MEAILAKDSMNGLSKNGVIPWKSKTDMKFFYNTTKNSTVVMGRNTYFSLPARPLKNRLNIVLTTKHFEPEENVAFTNDFDPSLFHKVFIIGGKQVYDQYIPLCDVVWVTQIKSNYFCDLIFDVKLLDLFEMKEVVHEDSELVIMKYSKRSG
jgi:dihydrofolate reductase